MINVGRLLGRILSGKQVLIVVVLCLGFIFSGLLISKTPLHIPHWSYSLQLPDQTVPLKRGMTFQQVELVLGKNIDPLNVTNGRGAYKEVRITDKHGNVFCLVFSDEKLRSIEELR